jgi:poly(A) polymerase
LPYRRPGSAARAFPLMRRSKDSLPPPPELPNFTVEPDSDDLPVEERHAGTGLVRHDVALDENRLDQDAARVVRRLEKAGFQAYLVGGCVRDLLLDRNPKDFDIATSARPEDVRQLFRNCRVIGRRFRLAHVLFGGGKIVEVATFRRKPQDAEEDDPSEDLLIRNDNVFGEAHEDALRRDFTINALFYDLERRQVLDWCGGMVDIRNRVIRTIGEPTVRFREDPVRILRAVKFAARLDVGISPSVYESMVDNRDELARAARPRIFEEVSRLLRGGAAHRSMWLLWESGAMGVLLPELSAFLDDDEGTSGAGARFYRRMGAIDQVTASRGAPDDLAMWCALLAEPLAEYVSGVRDPQQAAYEFLDLVIERIAMPRRIADGVRRVMLVLPKLAQQGRLGRMGRTELAKPAIDALELDLIARDRSTDMIEGMRAELGSFAPPPPSHRPAPRRPGRRG